jgi:hypothetical protein
VRVPRDCQLHIGIALPYSVRVLGRGAEVRSSRAAVPNRFGGPGERDREVDSAEISAAASAAGIGQRGESPLTVIRSLPLKRFANWRKRQRMERYREAAFSAEFLRSSSLV